MADLSLGIRKALLSLEGEETENIFILSLEKVDEIWQQLNRNAKLDTFEEQTAVAILKLLNTHTRRCIAATSNNGKSYADLKKENPEKGRHLEAYLIAFVDELIKSPPINSAHQVQIFTYIYFYLSILILLFPDNSDIIYKILKICQARTVAHESIFNYQYTLAGHLLNVYSKSIKTEHISVKSIFILSL